MVTHKHIHSLLVICFLLIFFCLFSSPTYAAVNKIYFTNYLDHTILRSNLDGSNVELIQSGLPHLNGLTVDSVNKKIYWSDSDLQKIQRSNYDGSNKEDVIPSVGYPGGLAVDTINSKIYFIDMSGTPALKKANLDGSNIQTLVTNTNAGYGIALDLTNNKVYWTEATNQFIKRANLDGSSVQSLVNIVSYDVKLNVPAGKFYWSSVTSIQVGDLTGGSAQNILTGIQIESFDIDQSSGKVYWSNPSGNTIHRANLDGSGSQTIVSGLNFPERVVLVDIPSPTPTPTSSPVQNTSSVSHSMPSAPSCNDEKPDGAPSIFQIDPHKTSATLHIVPAGGSYNKMYIAFGTEKDKQAYGVEFNQERSSGAITYTVNSLAPNTVYYFQTRAGNGCMPGNWSNEFKMKTASVYSAQKTTSRRYRIR